MANRYQSYQNEAVDFSKNCNWNNFLFRRRGQTKSNKQQNIITKPSVPKPANIRSPSLR